MTEGIMPKIDGEVFYGSEATYQAGNCLQVTAGEAITLGNIVYIKKSDGKAYVSDTGTADDIRANGIALQTVSGGSGIAIQTKGKYITSGLTANRTYYLGSSGAISLTQSGVQVGYSYSTTILMLDIVQDDKDIVGTIKPWAKSLTGMPSNMLTAFWKECDNTGALSDAESPLNGTTIPNLNGSGGGTKRFLRGSTTSGTTGGNDSVSTSSETNSGFVVNSGGSNAPWKNHSHTVTVLPSYYEVVWIIKIK